MANPIRNRWAFLVGINQYLDPQFATLKYCVNDVTALQALLEQVGYTVVCMHDERSPREARFPSRKNIEDEFKQLTQQVGPDDLLLVYFACHGTRASDGKPRLIAEDTRAYDLPGQAIAIAELETWMRDSGAERLVLMLDACHIGVGTDRRNMADPEFIRNVHELATGFALIAASTDQQSAYELGGLGHGLLSYYLLQGLAGEAEKGTSQMVTVRTLKEYVLNELKKKAVAVGFQQAPMGRADGNLGDMILVDWRSGERPSLVSPEAMASAQGNGLAPTRRTATVTAHTSSKQDRLKREITLLKEKLERCFEKRLLTDDPDKEVTLEKLEAKLDKEIQQKESELNDLTDSSLTS